MATSSDSSAPDVPSELPDTATLLEQVSDGFLAVDHHWQISYVNTLGAQVLRRHRRDLLGKSLWTEFAGLQGSVFGQAFHTAMQTQQPASFESFCPDVQRWLLCRAYPSPAGLSIFLRDVTEARETRRRLEENEQRYRSLYEQNIDAVFMFDLQGRFVDANRACEAISGYGPAELIGQQFQSFVASEDRLKLWELFTQVCGGQALRTEITLLHKKGHLITLVVSGVPIFVDGAVAGVYGIAKDVTQHKQAKDALMESEHWMRTIADASPLALLISRWDDGALLYTNQQFRDLVCLGSEEEALTHFAGEFYTNPSESFALREALTKQDKVTWEGSFCRSDGTPFWSSGAVRRMVYKGETVLFAASQDTTEQRRSLEEARDQADHDPLTGLLNHRAFHKQFAEQADRAAAKGRSLAVIVVDLDNFKFFNDVYGHAVGDDVLCRTAARLRDACGPEEIAARFGGDEFVLLLPNVGLEIRAEAIIARFAAALSGIECEPPGCGTAIPISLSLGAALLPQDALTRLEVMQVAEERLRHAKTGGNSSTEAQSLRLALRSKVQGFSMLESLVTAVDNKDRYTRRHSEDVMHYSLQIARALALEEDALRAVGISALLHDVGKIGVPDAILRKPGRLTQEEFEAVKQHPLMGSVIVGAVAGFEETLDAVRHHHERWDGGGYPFGLQGKETPLLARLLAVADAYSAMTTDRPYRKGMGAQEALGLLEEGAGTQWDPVCVAAFLDSFNSAGAGSVRRRL